MRYRVLHVTTYNYGQQVSTCHNLAHLTPREHEGQRRLSTQLVITPRPESVTEHTDYFGNTATAFAVYEPHDRLTITATAEMQVTPRAEPGTGGPAWEEVREQVRRGRDATGLEALEFIFDSTYVRTSAELAAYAAPSFAAGRPLLEAVMDLTRRIHADFEYDPRATTVSTPLSQVMALRRGVCQDFAHLQIGCLRSLGLAARYVSGYLRTDPPEGGERLVGADASHAWVSVYCPGVGWTDFDPTNACVPTDRHITLAWGRDYGDVSPIRGMILGGGGHALSVEVDVTAVE